MSNRNIAEDEWKKKQTHEQYKMLHEKGTDKPFTDEHLDNS